MDFKAHTVRALHNNIINTDCVWNKLHVYRTAYNNNYWCSNNYLLECLFFVRETKMNEN